VTTTRSSREQFTEEQWSHFITVRRFVDEEVVPVKMHNTRKARAITAEARDLLGGNGIVLDYQVMRHMVDMEAIHTFEGTETTQTLIVGRHHRYRRLHIGISACARPRGTMSAR
jgi:alkylation response protein AidB-like acyl-CoA dehydrogenase